MKKFLEALSKFKNILAIETSGLYCSVALKSNGLITQKATKEANKHGLVILDFIEDLLSKSNVKKGNIDLIAVSNGPGSFTGLRIGCSVAQALAFANNIPLLPISSLANLAFQANCEFKKSNIFVITNAHMKELYIGHYEFYKDQIKILKKESLINHEELFEHIDENSEETIYVGDGVGFLSKISKKNIYENLYSQANNMFGLIKIALKDKNFYLADDLSPNYLSGEDHWQKS